MKQGIKQATVVLLASVISLWAQKMSAEYRVEYGIFGKMGISTAQIEQNATDYRIHIEAKATGLAKLLSKGRIERYESIGKVVAGRFVPTTFYKDIKRADKRRIKRYLFDHSHRRIEVHEEKFQNGKKVEIKDTTLPYYAKDDILSLYFNIRAIIGDCQRLFDKTLHAVGAHKKTGKVRIETLIGKQREEAKRLLSKETSCYLKVTIYQKLFGSKGGELFLAMDDQGVTHKAILKDVVMFGDVRGLLESLTIEGGQAH